MRIGGDRIGMWDWWCPRTIPVNSPATLKKQFGNWWNTCIDRSQPLVYIGNGAKLAGVRCDIDHLRSYRNWPEISQDDQDMALSVAWEAMLSRPSRKTWVSVGRSEFDAYLPRETCLDVAAAWFTIAKKYGVGQYISEELQKEAVSMDREFVKLYKDGNVMGVETNVAGSEDFMRLFAQALADVVETGRWDKDWQFQFDQWLPQAFNINAKLNGYKSDVQEIRVIRAGYSSFDAEDQVYATPNTPSASIVQAIDEREDVAA